MRTGRIRIWRFSKAPDELRALHHGPEPPEWLVMVPRALGGSQIDEVILGHGRPGTVARYETSKGDLVYIGMSGVNQMSKLLASRERISIEKLVKRTSRN